MDVINHEKLERLGNEIGADNVPILLNIFLGELTEYMGALAEESGTQGDTLKEISHALKSSAASFGAEALCATAIEIDSLVKSGEHFDTPSYTSSLVELLQATHTEYEKIMQS